MQHPITIIGSGLAGYTVARELRQLNQNCALRIITADDGHFYSKPMLSNAFSQQKTPKSLIVTPALQMAEQLNVELLTAHEVTQINTEQHWVKVNDQYLKYHQLILAWGADPLPLPLAGTAADQFFSINNLGDYTHFYNALKSARRIAIIGAGLIGCEFANDLQQAGFSVHVIDPTIQPLGRLIPEVAGQTLQQALQDLGVNFYFEKVVNRIDQSDKGYRLTLTQNTPLEEIDVVLSAVGLRPRTALATAAGLLVDRGIVVDRYLKTSATDVYALGDCAQVEGLLLPFVMPLMNAARALAKTLAGQPTPVSYPAMPVVVKTQACPVVVFPPPSKCQGEWQIEAEGLDVRALFYNSDQQLAGFVLMGNKIEEKMTLTKQLPPILA